MMEVSTAYYKCGKGFTGIVSSNYDKQGGCYLGVCCTFIFNCPNRYYARKAAIYVMKHLGRCHGFVTDHKKKEEMKPYKQQIDFSEIAFAIQRSKK